MGFDFLFFWLTLILMFELFLVNTAAYLLSLLLMFALVLIFFLFWTEFDVLASLILGVYSSVFVVFFLLLLHFATFWAPANKQGSSEKSAGIYVFVSILVIFFFLCLVTVYPSCVNSQPSTFMFSYLWQDFFFFVNTTTSMSVQMLHHFFFHFFVFETIVLNLYLFFSLVLALGLLFLFRLYANLKPHSKVWGLQAGIGQNNTTVHLSQTTTVRVRQVNKFSRQTSSQNSSVIRYR